jgi:hypothetical protein
MRKIALTFAFAWTSLGVAVFYATNGGWHGAVYQAFQMTGGAYDISAAAIVLLLLGFGSSLVAVKNA